MHLKIVKAYIPLWKGIVLGKYYQVFTIVKKNVFLFQQPLHVKYFLFLWLFICFIQSFIQQTVAVRTISVLYHNGQCQMSGT